MGDEVRIFELPAVGDTDPAAVQRGAMPGGGAVEGTGDGLQNGGSDRAAPGEEGDPDAPVVATAQEGPRAVDRIDEIGERAVAGGEIVRGLLRQPAMGRTGGEQPVGEQAI